MLLVAAALAAEHPPFAVTVEPVHEVCLLGAADPAWAARRVAGEGLAPALKHGRAVVQVCGTSATFGGRDFREGIVALVVTDGTSGEAAYLLAAVNTVPFYAWVERARNKSPYRAGHVVESFGPEGARLEIRAGDTGLVATRAAAPLPTPTPDTFDGPIHQPGHTWFHAHLEGNAATVPFAAGDTFTLAVRGADPLSDLLADAGFVPTTWRLRAAGRHAKTRTLKPAVDSRAPDSRAPDSTASE